MKKKVYFLGLVVYTVLLPLLMYISPEPIKMIFGLMLTAFASLLWAYRLGLLASIWVSMIMISENTVFSFHSEYLLLRLGALWFISLIIGKVIDGYQKQKRYLNEQIIRVEETNRKLAESEGKYRALVELASDGIFIQSLNGRILECNDAGCRMFGYSREEMLKAGLCDLVAEEIAITLPDSIPEEEIMGDVPQQWCNRRKDGTLFPTEVYNKIFDVGGEKRLIAYVRDISPQKRYEEELRKEKELFRVTIHSIGDAVITTDTSSRIVTLNEVAENLTGWSAQEAKGRPLDTVFTAIHEYTRIPCENPVEKALQAGKVVQMKDPTILIARDGTERCIADSSAAIKDAFGNVLGVVLVFRDVTEERKRQEEIRYLSFHDKLTGLFNRAFFEEELERINTERQLPFSIIMGDVNGLKLVNDGFGHNVGDRLLKQMARILKEVCRAEDVIARIGGDEFAILLPHTGSKDKHKVLERIKEHCLKQSPDPIQPSMALGAATKNHMEEDVGDTLKRAENRMYQSKLLESKNIRNSIILSLRKTLEERTHETEQHAYRIKELSQQLGREMHLHQNQLDELALLALLHDIGKIAIPDFILGKRDNLDGDEWNEIMKHCEAGYRIAAASPELAPVADYILCHHERWDGKGYPQGLKGEDIPLLARIITVVDAFDAMTHERPYRKAMTWKAAIDQLKENAGIQFDPVITGQFIKMVQGAHASCAS